MNNTENIEVRRAEKTEKAIIRNLMEYYQYDATEFNNEDLCSLGLFGYKYLDHYWTEHGNEVEGRIPYLVKVNGNIAGFVLINNFSLYDRKPDVKTNTIAEFFIMRKWRKLGVGRKAAIKIFDHHQGNWEVKQEKENYVAQIFWESVIQQYSNGRYTKIESFLPKWEGPIIIFNNQYEIQV